MHGTGKKPSVLSIPDMAMLGAAALLLFGPEQLPRVARKAGGVIREIQNTSQSFIRELERAADVQDAAGPVLAHRLCLHPAADITERAEELVAGIAESLPVPLHGEPEER